MTERETANDENVTFTLTGDELINLALRGALPEEEIIPCQSNSTPKLSRRASTGRPTKKSKRLSYKKKVKTVQICRVERDQFGRSYVGPVRKIRVHAGANHVKSQPTKVSIVSTFKYY